MAINKTNAGQASAYLNEADVDINRDGNGAEALLMETDDTTAFGEDLLTAAEESAPADNAEEEIQDIIAPDATPPVANMDTERQIMNREVEQLRRLRERNARQSHVTTYGTLISALKTGHTREGRISGVVIRNRVCYWVIYQDNIVIQIPFSETYTTLPAALMVDRSPATLRKQQQFLAKSLGATIPFVLTSHAVDPNGVDTFTASRLKALEKQRRMRFGRKADPRDRIEQGQEVVGRILSTGTFAAYVTVGGVDVRVQNHHLTHRHVKDVAAEFPVDTPMVFRVTRLDLDANDNPVNIALSARPIEIEDFAENRKFIVPGGRHLARVTSITKINSATNPQVLVQMFLDGIDMPAFSRSLRLNLQDELHSGDEVYFEALGVTKSGYAHGAILRFVRSY